MAPIKDIRMIRNKVTGGNKDFAFVEFFSPEEAAMALRKANAPDFRVMGQKVTVMYSRTKQDD
jgi:RNA recognition motif-containing protein